MARYTRGPLIDDVETAVFCLLAGDMLYHERAILPACQIKSWPLSKIEDRVKKGKLFKAEFIVDPGEVIFIQNGKVVGKIINVGV